MDHKLADDIFRITVDAQRIVNLKNEIQERAKEEYGRWVTWDELCTEAMKFKMENKFNG